MFFSFFIMTSQTNLEENLLTYCRWDDNKNIKKVLHNDITINLTENVFMLAASHENSMILSELLKYYNDKLLYNEESLHRIMKILVSIEKQYDDDGVMNAVNYSWKNHIGPYLIEKELTKLNIS